MKLKLNFDYKSLIPFESDELSDFTIITGENGSGKSQLLNLLRESPNLTILDIIPQIKRVQAEGIIKSQTFVLTEEILKTKPKGIHNQFLNSNQQVKAVFDYLIGKGTNKEQVFIDRNKLLYDEPKYKQLIYELYTSEGNSPGITIEYLSVEHEKTALRKLFQSGPDLYNFLMEISVFCNKQVKDIAGPEFYTTPIPESIIEKVGFGTTQIENVFYNYARRRNLNHRKYFDKMELGQSNKAISDSEFVRLHTQPWVIINEIFQANLIGYYFDEIRPEQFSADVPLVLRIRRVGTNAYIPIEELSSGEKIIMGLILKLFTTTFFEENLEYPELLILDEPDASLHPEMCKLMLHILENTFVKKFKIKVIMTSHSPTTIALANESSIYQLTNWENTGLKKISKDKALQILTGLIPTLSIDYNNHRQVFVESLTDVKYYQYLFDKHLPSNKLPRKLYFISNAPGKSNCSQVYCIVQEIRNSGNKTSFGIADWDLSNQAKDFVFVHGLNERYSIENFILDPIYLIIHLLELKAHEISKKLGIFGPIDPYSLSLSTNERLQELCKIFFVDFENTFPSFKYECNKEIIHYLNERHIEVPSWFLKLKGHDLDKKIKTVYPALAGKYKSEGELQIVLMEIMAISYPLVPLTSIKLIEQLSNS
jgi:AAA15 family ATPase/GTPase